MFRFLIFGFIIISNPFIIWAVVHISNMQSTTRFDGNIWLIQLQFCLSWGLILYFTFCELNNLKKSFIKIHSKICISTQHNFTKNAWISARSSATQCIWIRKQRLWSDIGPLHHSNPNLTLHHYREAPYHGVTHGLGFAHTRTNFHMAKCHTLMCINPRPRVTLWCAAPINAWWHTGFNSAKLALFHLLDRHTD